MNKEVYEWLGSSGRSDVLIYRPKKGAPNGSLASPGAISVQTSLHWYLQCNGVWREHFMVSPTIPFEWPWRCIGFWSERPRFTYHFCPSLAIWHQVNCIISAQLSPVCDGEIVYVFLTAMLPESRFAKYQCSSDVEASAQMLNTYKYKRFNNWARVGGGGFTMSQYPRIKSRERHLWLYCR